MTTRRQAVVWETTLQFEWDPGKAAYNERKHGITFDWAKRVFDDPFAFEWIDDLVDYGEERCITIGTIDGILVMVVFTGRDERTRVISARRATRQEANEYFHQNTRGAAPNV